MGRAWATGFAIVPTSCRAASVSGSRWHGPSCTTRAIVLADEPTASLDSKTGLSVIDLFRRLNRERGTTFLLATHDPQVVAARRSSGSGWPTAASSKRGGDPPQGRP